MFKLTVFPTKITGRGLLIGLGFIIIIHLILFVYFTQMNKRSETRVNRNIIVQQIINLIERINYASPAERSTVVSAVDIPNLTITLNTEPKWKLRFNANASLWKISEAIGAQKKEIHLSLKYAPFVWLNISMPIAKTRWWMQVFLLTVEIIVVGSILFSIWSINRFVAPLRNFKSAADRLGVDLDSPPLQIGGPAIVQATAQAMNQLQQRIRDLIRERTNMLAALSHDLRTPITRMKLRAQFIQDKELYEKNIADLDQMEEMIAETLAFAKHDNTSEKLVKLDLLSLLHSIINDFIDMGYPIKIKNFPNSRIVIRGRAVSLRRAFNNIIDNAIKYGKNAVIEVINEENSVSIIITDEGPGIPETQLKKVFEPFYRGDSSRSRATGGTGLGLAVTRTIIRGHQGQIKLRNLENVGLEVTVILPLL